MNTFASAVQNQVTRTENGMIASKDTGSSCVDLFFSAGASRGNNITPQFVSAMVENEELAIRLVQWLRDVRGGAGERELFRQVMLHLETNNPDVAIKLLPKIPELGRWDDLLIFQTKKVKDAAYSVIKTAVLSGNNLCAKWLPRKGVLAHELRNFFGMSPKTYRKTLVGLTNVVEQKMCAKEWDAINFSHVPSVAHARYKKAFSRNTPLYSKYIDAVLAGNDSTVKINASAIFPHDVLKGVATSFYSVDKTRMDATVAQWNALPNYIGDANILPMIDVSGSMGVIIGGTGKACSTTAMDIAVSLGLYCADKNTGKFKDIFLTFSGAPSLVKVEGNIVQKVQQTIKADWGMNTNLVAAMSLVLKAAVDGAVPQSEMPAMLLILSDMQFDACTRFDDSAFQMINRKYEEAGYVVPKIVFWNLYSHSNVPVKHTTNGVALVSGFSPAILTAILAADLEQFTPTSIMLKTLMQPKYDF